MSGIGSSASSSETVSMMFGSILRHWQYTFRHFFIVLDFSVDRTSCWNNANLGLLSTFGTGTEGALSVRKGMCKGLALGRGLESPLGLEDIAISISLLLPCLVAGRRLGNILSANLQEGQRKFALVIMVRTYENVCAKDDGANQEATIE